MFAFSTLEPITEPRSSHPLLADIESHLTRQQFRYYCGFDSLTTNIHEGTHGLQANIRNQRGARMVDAWYEQDERYSKRARLSQVGRKVWSHSDTPEGSAAANGERANAFYAYNNQYAWWPEPNFRKSQVGPFVPEDFQSHHLFRTYISGATDWEDSPFYVLDEDNAYNSGAQAGESGSEIEFALIFKFFALALIEACKQHDPTYRADLVIKPFVDWQIYRLAYIVAQHGNDKHKRLLDRLTKAAGLS